jgi:hypothetical protein
MKIYNNVLNRKDSPFVPVFNPCDVHGKPHTSDVWNANGWSGHKRVIIDWEADNDVLINVEPTAGAHAFVRDRWFHIVEAARANGVETLGAYGIPWCRYTDMARRVARNAWAHIAVLDWVCPSFYWYEEEPPEYERKVQATTTALMTAMFVTGQKTVVPMVSIESMKKDGGARILTDKDSITNTGGLSPHYNTLGSTDLRIGIPVLFLTLTGAVKVLGKSAGRRCACEAGGTRLNGTLGLAPNAHHARVPFVQLARAQVEERATQMVEAVERQLGKAGIDVARGDDALAVLPGAREAVHGLLVAALFIGLVDLQAERIVRAAGRDFHIGAVHAIGAEGQARLRRGRAELGTVLGLVGRATIHSPAAFLPRVGLTKHKRLPHLPKQKSNHLNLSCHPNILQLHMS